MDQETQSRAVPGSPEGELGRPALIRAYEEESLDFSDRVQAASAIRQQGVAWSDTYGGHYVLGRYPDVQAAGRNFDDLINGFLPTTGGDSEGRLIGMRELAAAEDDRLLEIPSQTDPPDHAQYRRALADFFSPRTARRHEDRLRYWVTMCIDQVIESGAIDFAGDLAGPVPFLFFCEQLGIPVEQWRAWRDPLHRLQTSVQGSPEQLAAARDEAHNVDVLRELVADRRAHPKGDLLSELALAVRADGQLFTVAEVAALARIVLVGGAESVGALLTQALLYLDDNPADRQRLIDDPSLVESANEEFLRFFSPATRIARTVRNPVSYHDHTLDVGDKVLLHLFAANHDSAVFEDPDKLIIDREHNDHVAFGVGPHKCPGLHLGRAELKVLLQEILRRIPDFKITRSGIVSVATLGHFSGYLSLPATFTFSDRIFDSQLPGPSGI
jgi:cytochrome P450